MRILSIANESDLWDLLEEANGAGDGDALCQPSRDARGTPFLASLADDGDSTHVEYIIPDETGRVSCPVVGCDNCGHGDNPDWTPTFPVTCLDGAS